MEKTSNNSVLKKRYIYPIWWILSWLRYCKTGRKIASLLLFVYFISAFITPFIILKNETGNIKYFLAIIPFIMLTWPFILVIAPPKVYRDEAECCSGCGHVNHDLRVVDYKIGIALFGLIPISGTYKRTLCKVCRNSLYRIAIIFENIFSLIWFPVGTVLGIIWIFKNQSSNRINIKDTIEILSNIQTQCKKHNEEIEVQKIQEVINKFEIKFAKQTEISSTILKKTKIQNVQYIPPSKNFEKIWKNYSTTRGILKVEIYLINKFPWDGDSVLLNELPAPDGKYKIGFLFYIIVKNGMVNRVSWI